MCCCCCRAAGELQGFARFDPVSPFLSCPPNRPPTGYSRWRFCDLSRLPAGCIVYSVGPVQSDYAFERDVIANTKCEVHTFDCKSEGKSIKEGRHTHHKLCIGQGKAKHMGWLDIVVKLGHHIKGIAALKIGAAAACSTVICLPLEGLLCCLLCNVRVCERKYQV